MSEDQSFQDTIGLIVHSYNNYLSGVMGFTELAQMECEQDSVNEKMDMSLESGKEAVLFGKQLLSSIGRLQSRFEPVEIIELIKQFAQQYCHLSYSDKSSEVVYIQTEPKWFTYCLNIISEFCQDFFKDIEIDITLDITEHDINISFFSPAMSLTKEQIENLFLPFYSSRVLLGKKELGLAVVKGFFEQMKGHISWDKNGGFLISLPKCSR